MKDLCNIYVTLCLVCMVALCGDIHSYAQVAPQTNVQSPETVQGSEAPVQELSPQVQKETLKTETVTNESTPIKKTEPAEGVKKEEKKPAAAASDDKSQKADAAKGLKADSKTLLSITDGAFRYSRIPGITIKENNEQIIVKIEKETQNIDTGEKGLFGLSKQASDRMAKIILLVIIVFVFILYRMRARNTSGSVLRRFPK
ncbi:MAG: hypothetical protein ACUVRK_02220 [Spirochaetota bacterium]